MHKKSSFTHLRRDDTLLAESNCKRLQQRELVSAPSASAVGLQAVTWE